MSVILCPTYGRAKKLFCGDQSQTKCVDCFLVYLERNGTKFTGIKEDRRSLIRTGKWLGP